MKPIFKSILKIFWLKREFPGLKTSQHSRLNLVRPHSEVPSWIQASAHWAPKGLAAPTGPSWTTEHPQETG